MAMNAEMIKALVQAGNALAEVIAEAGEQGIPSGHLYSVCMGHMSIHTYTQLIGLLKSAGRVRESGNVLYAVK